MDNIRLLGLQRAEFDRAEQFESHAQKLQIGILLAAIFNLIVPTCTVFVYILAVINVLMYLLWFYCIEQSKESHSTAETARRATILKNALAIDLDTKSYSDLILQFKVKKDSAKKWEDENYFKTNSNYGYAKLAEMLQESSFWTKHLLQKFTKQIWFQFSFVLIVSLFALFMIPIINHNKTGQLVGNIICLILIWLITGNVFTKALKLTNSLQRIDNIQNSLDFIVRHNKASENVLLLFCNYNSIVESNPVIPSKIYLKNKDRLNSLWEERETLE